MPIRVAIRADAGRALGTGHYSRAHAVADALLAAGGTDVLLVTGEEGEPLVRAYFPSGIPILALAPAEADAAGTMRALRRIGWAPDVLYLDQYGEVAEWEAEAAEAGFGLLVLDDLDAARRADIIVRPHGGDAGDVHGILLRGPAYLPLSSEVASLAGRDRRTDAGRRLRLNICFGGTDPTGETAKALQAVAGLDGLDVDVVIGPGASADPALLGRAEQATHVTVHRAPPHEKLSELISHADMALGAGGVMLWERLCLGVPSLVIAVADNQRPQVEAMAEAGAIRFIGDRADVTSETIARAVAGLAADKPARDALSAAGQRLVDGRGALRLAAWLRALALDARAVRLDDAADLLEWRTDESNWQHNWDGADKPDLASHIAWLKTKLADPQCVFHILRIGEEPVGVVRFDLKDGGHAAYLSIYLVPSWHGRKMGLAVYCAAERALRRSHPGVHAIVSRIHSANAASERLHRDAGFQVTPSSERDDWLDACKRID